MISRRKKIALLFGANSPYPSEELYKQKDALSLYTEEDTKGLWTAVNASIPEPPSTNDYEFDYTRYTTGAAAGGAFFARWDGSASKTLTAGTRMSITFRVRNVGDIQKGANYVFRLLAFGGDFGIGETTSDNLYPYHTSINNPVYSTQEDGVIASLSNEYGKWITVSGTLKADTTAIPRLFQNTAAGRSLDIKEIVLGDEVFSFSDDASNAIFESDSKTFSFTPRAGIEYVNSRQVEDTYRKPELGEFSLMGIPLTSYGHLISPDLPATVGQAYRITVWARSNTYFTQGFRLWEGVTVSPDLVIDNNYWKKFEFDVVASADVMVVKAYIRVNGGSPRDTLELDGFSYVKI